jgi:polysaccharide deacetylase 2 family uncharacterized protein YibQ
MLKALCPWLLALSYWFSASAQAEPRLAIIIDDIGYNKVQSERAARLNGKFTLAVLPFTPHGFSSAQLAHSSGKELMLHLPMSAINNQALGRGGLVSGMEKAAFLNVIRQDLASIPHIKGVNNHMGSRLTQEAEPMQWLMSELRMRGLYFVDSRTSAQTKAFDIANGQQVASLKRDVFLDDSSEPSAIKHELTRAIVLARERGAAVAIGHPYPATLDILERAETLAEKHGVTLVYASQLVRPAAKVAPRKSAPSVLKDEGFPYCPAPPTPFLFKLETDVDLYDNTSIMPYKFFGY